MASDEWQRVRNWPERQLIVGGELARTIDDLAPSLASGELEPDLAVLVGLLDICEAEHLYANEARLRRWLSLPPRAESNDAW